MGKIVAVGGEDVKKGEFKKYGYRINIPGIDREIIRLTGKKTPKILFIPTASRDNEQYIREFEKWCSKLECKVDVLTLTKNPDAKQAKEKILSSDAVYVGGGNTLRMMTIWRKLGIDNVFKEAFKKGIVLSGVSAGGICWFNYGHSDSRMFTSKDVSWPFIKVTGIGFYPFVFCPHYHFEKREKDFKSMIRRDKLTGLAVDNKAAIEIVDDKIRILKTKKDAKAYTVKLVNGKIEEKEIINTQFKPISEFI